MPREIVGKGLRFSLRHAPCAHICRYCLISESRKRSALPFSRFEKLVHRFHDWKQSNGRDDLARSSGAQRSRGLHQLGVMHPDLARPAGRATGLDQKAIALLLLDSMHRGCRVPRVRKRPWLGYLSPCRPSPPLGVGRSPLGANFFSGLPTRESSSQ